ASATSCSSSGERRAGRRLEGGLLMAHRPILAALVVVLLLAAGPAPAADPLVISMWGGNWKDTVEKVIAKPFTAKTGIPVEFEVGGTLDRLAKARVAKAAPLVDITFTTSHVGRLYIDRKSTRLNSSHVAISYAVFC